jgi:hypothetical protein
MIDIVERLRLKFGNVKVTNEREAKDRSYYRLEDNRDLIEAAKHQPNAELCLVLGERLYESIERIAQLEDEEESRVVARG